MRQEELSEWVLVSKSSLPQFIQDLNNPWIKANRRWIEQRPDPIHDLCDLDSPLRHEGEDNRVLPPDLFRWLEIDNNRSDIERSGWGNARERLREIKSCPAALKDVQHLHVDIVLSGENYGEGPEPVDPSAEIAQLFVDVLGSMPNLRRLDWYIPTESTRFLGEYFVEKNLRLPSIKHLLLGAFSEYLIPICPNLEKLEAGQQWSWYNRMPFDEEPNPCRQLIQATKSVKSINSLSYSWGEGSCDSQVLQDIREAMPNIAGLKMDAYFEDYRRSDIDPGKKLMEVLMCLKEFPKLEHLRLPDARGLGIGFRGGAWCGHAYRGPRGRGYGRQIAREEAEAMERAGAMTMAILPHLKSLGMDSTEAVVLSGDGKNPALLWPWTGRMEEWVYEAWPEPGDVSD